MPVECLGPLSLSLAEFVSGLLKATSAGMLCAQKAFLVYVQEPRGIRSELSPASSQQPLFVASTQETRARKLAL